MRFKRPETLRNRLQRLYLKVFGKNRTLALACFTFLIFSLGFFAGNFSSFLFAFDRSTINSWQQPPITVAKVPEEIMNQNPDCCHDVNSLSCVACSMNLSEERVCLSFPDLADCVKFPLIRNSVQIQESSIITESLALSFTSSLTFISWLKLNSFSGNAIFQLTSFGGGKIMIVISNEGRISLADGMGTWYMTESALELGRLYQLAFTIEPMNHEVELILNGEKAGMARVNKEIDEVDLEGTDDFMFGSFNGYWSEILLLRGKWSSSLYWEQDEKSSLDYWRGDDDNVKLLHFTASTAPTVKTLSSISQGLRGNPATDSPVKNDLFKDFDDFERTILSSLTKTQLIEGDYDNIEDEAILSYSEQYGQHYKELARNAMKHAYGNYEKFAFGHDELKPKSGKFNERWGGRGVTLVDSLDTLWLMDMKDEFYRARDWVRSHLNFNQNKFVSFFETTIRDLGGLLSAFYLSGDEIFKEKAIDLGKRLFVDVENNNFAVAQINLATGASKPAGWLKSQTLLAEFGTCQLEFGALSKLTGEPKYIEKSREMMRKAENGDKWDGLLPTYLNVDSMRASKKLITFGAMGDSFYEYLLKIWVQSNFQASEFRQWYDQTVDGLERHLWQRTQPDGLYYVADATAPSFALNRKMDHLACFTAGMLALGSYTSEYAPGSTGERNAARDLKMAKQLMFTCVEMYLRQPSGLSPENINADNKVDFRPGAKNYILRPEMVESLFILHQITRHPIYRIWGKKVMQNIEDNCRTSYGYGHYKDVTKEKSLGAVDDAMESYFLAETLKYHYLLQAEQDLIDLKKWVFNTEAHPLKIFDE